ncbi:MAG: hypothetical protein IH856_15430 [Deltaproteobacteria bacterium]|nr:hypothetical protein [Deltaproteobacteria bacterium]
MAASLVAFREWLGPFRGIFFLVALILVGRSHYLYWQGHGRSRRLTTVTLWVSTALTLIMVGVFYVYGNPLFF